MLSSEFRVSERMLISLCEKKILVSSAKTIKSKTFEMLPKSLM